MSWIFVIIIVKQMFRKYTSNNGTGSQVNALVTRPTMGGIVDAHTTVVGGKPKADWTGLEKAVTTLSPGQLRQFYHDAKAKKYREQGREEKFGKTSNLSTFARDTKEHAEDKGLDTVTYLPSPTDPREMLSILTSYSLYPDVATVENLIRFQRSKYDDRDIANDKEMRKHLENSL